MASTDAKQGKPGAPSGLEFFHDVSMKITVEFARTEMSIRDLLRLKAGGVLELNKMAGEPLDIRLNGRLIARGEAVIVNDRFGVRVTEIVSPEDVIDSLGEGGS
jgi:flagellar motor switch protein FliN/FliY